MAQTSARYIEQFNNAWGVGIIFFDAPSDHEVLSAMKNCTDASWISVPILTPDLQALMWAKAWGLIVMREDLKPQTEVHGGQVHYAQ